MKHLTYQRIALGGLRARKKQSIPLALGIVLAVYFACTVLLAGQSLLYTQAETDRDRIGEQDAALLHASSFDVQLLTDSSVVSRLETIQTLAVADVGGNAVCAVGKGEPSALVMARKRCTEGRLPETADEIAVEAVILRRLDPDAQVGDRLTLTLHIPDGQNGYLPETRQQTYTLTGILADQILFLESSGGATEDAYDELCFHFLPAAITGADATVADGGMPVTHLLIQHPANFSERAFLDALDLPLDPSYMSRRCQSAYWAEGPLNEIGEIPAMYALTIVGGVLILAACLGIVNAFTANLAERRGQTGLLRAVGATRRQIRRIFGREALTIALLTAPAALGLSCLTVWLGDAVLGLYQFHTTPAFLLAALLISLLVVFLAAQIPLLSASRISPMQAIRDTSLLRARKRLHIRPQKTFHVPQLLARRHMQLYRTHRLGATLLVALSLPLLSVAGYFCWMLLAHPIYGGDAYDYRLIFYDNTVSDLVEEQAATVALSAADSREIAALPLVSRVDGMKHARVNWLLDGAPDYLTLESAADWCWQYFYLSEDFPDDHREYERLRQQQRIDRNLFTADLYAASAEQVALLAPYVLEGTIDIDALNAGREVLVIAPPAVYISENASGGGRMTYEPEAGIDYAIGAPGGGGQKGGNYCFQNDVFFAGEDYDLCRLSTPGLLSTDENDEVQDFLTDVSRSDATVRVGAVLPTNFPKLDSPFTEVSNAPGTILTTLAGMEALGMSPQGYELLNVRLSQSPDEEQEAQLTAALKQIANRTPGVKLYSQSERQREERQGNAMFVTCAASIVLLCLALSASIISNSLTNRIRADRQAIGTLRAVGAPLEVILASYRRQMAAMLLSGAALGLLLTLVMVGVLHRAAFWLADLKLTALLVLGPDAAFLLLLGLCCGVNLRVRLREVARRSIVENVREL